MDIRYLYSSDGTWIAFQNGHHVFDRSGTFLGWTPWAGDATNDVVTVAGDYIGTIVPVDPDHGRLYALAQRPYRGYPGRPDKPAYPGYPGHPGPLPPVSLPAGTRDIDAPATDAHLF